MTARIIDGKEISAGIKGELRARVSKLAGIGVTPGLAGIMVGEAPGSLAYVRLKQKACEKLGIHSEMLRLPGDIAESDLIKEIGGLNSDASVHAIFIQLPLPDHIDESEVLAAVSPDKDVDGFHPVNIGRAWTGQAAFVPAAALAVYEILVRSGCNPGGKDVVIVNADDLVGKPLAAILVQGKNKANVTLCDASNPNLASHTRRADILVVSVNKPRFITADMVKDGVVVVDAGSNRVEDTDTGKVRTVGDVDFEAVKEEAEAITPVPGGVGPMLVTMLLANTVTAVERQVSD